MTTLLLAVAIVVFVSAACSLLEAVLYSVPLSQVEALVEAGRPSGRILQKLRGRIEAPITAILSLNTISNTAGAAVAGAIAARVLGEDRLVFFSAAFTLLILLASEVLPKTAGVVYARALAGVVARPLQWLTVLFTPIVWLCGFVTRLVARMPADSEMSPEELLVMARAGRRSGAIEEGEGVVIENALTLKHRTVHDVMTPRTVVFTLPASETVGSVFRRQELIAHSRFPVYVDSQDNPVGLVYSRDVLAEAAADRMETPLSQLARPLRFMAEQERLDRALNTFLLNRDHLVGVIGPFGGFNGVASLEDVLEELLGREIVDSTDTVEDLRALAQSRREKLLRASGQTGPSEDEP